MARSRHTDPRPVRAERRVRFPRRGRGDGDPSRQHRSGRLAKELGVRPEGMDAGLQDEVRFPRILVREPEPGWLHPAVKVDIRKVLERLGPESFYGLRTVELVQSPANPERLLPLLGRLLIPGRIQLFAQRRPPWILPLVLGSADLESVRRYGARVECGGQVPWTRIDWPGSSLRRFMLLEVFLHELGHHVLQHERGKTGRRIARTLDHEAFADQFARRCRQLFPEGEEEV